MHGTATEATKVLLANAGFVSTDAIYQAANTATGERQRILQVLASTFADLDSAESNLLTALQNIQVQAAREVNSFEQGHATTDIWITQSAGRITQHSAKVNDTAKTITMLTWLLNGSPRADRATRVGASAPRAGQLPGRPAYPRRRGTTVTEPDPKILDKVRKLLTQAEDRACTPAEAERSSARQPNSSPPVRRRHQAKATAADPTATAPATGSSTFPPRTPTPRAACSTSSPMPWAARPSAPGARAAVAVAHLFGYGSDLDRIVLLFDSLVTSWASPWLSPRSRRVMVSREFRRAFMLGFAMEVGGRLEKAERRARAEADDSGPSTAVMLG